MSNRVLFINEGRLAFDGPVDALGRRRPNPRYALPRIDARPDEASGQPVGWSGGHWPTRRGHWTLTALIPRRQAGNAMNWNVLSAIFRRNFVAYFTSPTGYVFICLFMLLQLGGGVLAARVLQRQPRQPRPAQPGPAVDHAGVHSGDHDVRSGPTSERQGTDELLLTIPADRLRRGARQIPGGRGDLLRVAGVFVRLAT